MFTMRAVDLRDTKRYFIENRYKRGTVLAWFDSVEIAGLVLRFLNGTNLKPNDSDDARRALRDFDMRENKVVPITDSDPLEGVSLDADPRGDVDLDPLRDM